MSASHYFAVDVGGTSIKTGIVSQAGDVVEKLSFATDRELAFEDLSDEIAKQLAALDADSRWCPEGIGISVPGYPDPDTGRLVGGGNVNFPALKNQSLATALAHRMNLPTTIENDGICAALGELNFGLGRTIDSFIMLVIGTGIGGAIVNNRMILQGPNREPPEFGAIVLHPGNGAERKGIRGSFEDLAGGRAILSAYAAQTGESTADLNINLLRERALEGDLVAVRLFEQMSAYIAQAIGIIINVTGQTHCVIGGGVSHAGNFLVDRVKARLPEYTWPTLQPGVEIRVAENGNDAGMIGAMSIYTANADASVSAEPLPRGKVFRTGVE